MNILCEKKNVYYFKKMSNFAPEKVIHIYDRNQQRVKRQLYRAK